MIKASINTKSSILKIALGSLILTSLNTGSAEALPFSCTVQCTKSSVAKNSKRLNECASKCDNTKIMDILLPHAEKLDEANQRHFETALKYQQSSIEKQLKAEMAKKKPSQSKIKDLNAKQDKLIVEINRVKGPSTTESAQKAPERPTTLPGEKNAPPRPTSGSHLNEPDISKPPVDMPPVFNEDLNESPYHEMPAPKSPRKSLPPTPQKRASTVVAEQPQGQDEKGETPSHLAGLGDNPMARLRKVPKSEIQDKSGVAGAGTVKGSDQSATGAGTQHTDTQHATSDQPKQPLSLQDQIKAGKQLKKVDPEAEAKRRAAAEEKLKNNPKANPSGQSEDIYSQLRQSMEKRDSDMNPDKKVNPHLDFEQNFDD